MGKTSRLLILTGALAATLVLVPSVEASRGGGVGHGGGGHGGSGASGRGGAGGHHGFGHHHGRGVFFAGAFFGGAVLWPWWYPDTYGTIVYGEPVWMPQPGIDPSYPAAADPTQYWWYYCPDSQTYYPYVQQCASEWQRVLPQPPAK